MTSASSDAWRERSPGDLEHWEVAKSRDVGTVTALGRRPSEPAMPARHRRARAGASCAKNPRQQHSASLGSAALRPAPSRTMAPPSSPSINPSGRDRNSFSIVGNADDPLSALSGAVPAGNTTYRDACCIDLDQCTLAAASAAEENLGEDTPMKNISDPKTCWRAS